jgi:hypothetical protein
MGQSLCVCLLCSLLDKYLYQYIRKKYISSYNIPLWYLGYNALTPSVVHS